MGLLHLVPIYPGASRELLEPLAAELASLFRMQAALHPPAFDPELAYDASRAQYNSRTLLLQLLQNRPAQSGRILGVTGQDLFIPVLTYVFGEAQLDGPAAVVSSFRLDPRLYGLPANRDLLFGRLLKEAVHELGHTYNLVHCHNHPCVMLASTYAEDIDLKSAAFCAACRRQISACVGG